VLVKIWHSDAARHDSVFIDMEGVMNPNEIAVMDKAYENYAPFGAWCEKDVYFVTRLKDNAKEELKTQLDLSDSDSDSVLRDALVTLNYTEANQPKSVELRLVS